MQLWDSQSWLTSDQNCKDFRITSMLPITSLPEYIHTPSGKGFTKLGVCPVLGHVQTFPCISETLTAITLISHHSRGWGEGNNRGEGR